MTFVMDVPQDVEALVVQHLLARGFNAMTELPVTADDADTSIQPGVIRVTRTGGDIDDDSPTQDNAHILIETWDRSAVDAWNAIIRVWAEMSLVEHRGEFDGSLVYRLIPQVPRTLDDDREPFLHHYQFLSEVLVPLTTLNIGGP